MSESALKDRISALCTEQTVGLVSPDIPLLSNLSVYDNIALVSRYLTKEKDKEIQQVILQQLDILDIRSLKFEKPFRLDSETIFKVKLLRALSLKDSLTIIDRPFVMLNNIADIAPVKKMLETLGEYIGEGMFFDFEWNKSKY